MSAFWRELDGIREQRNVLKHPFYRRWSSGQLGRDELATYAGEYHHAVVALARATTLAARSADAGTRNELERHAEEERAHIALWRGFADAVGGAPAPTPTPETVQCVEAWTDENRDLLSHLVVLYAIEASQPAIAEAKRVGLSTFYGVKSGKATSYFDVHVHVDHQHARAGRRLISRQLADGDAHALLAQAEGALKANWTLLDGVDRLQSS